MMDRRSSRPARNRDGGGGLAPCGQSGAITINIHNNRLAGHGNVNDNRSNNINHNDNANNNKTKQINSHNNLVREFTKEGLVKGGYAIQTE